MILLDTHVVIWLASEPAKLSKKAGEAIRRASQETGIAISAITLWELAWLATHDRLEITGTVEAFVEKSARGPQSGRSRYRLPFWPTSFPRIILAILATDSSVRPR